MFGYTDGGRCCQQPPFFVVGVVGMCLTGHQGDSVGSLFAAAWERLVFSMLRK